MGDINRGKVSRIDVHRNEKEVRESFHLCHAEASSSFGDGRIFIEK